MENKNIRHIRQTSQAEAGRTKLEIVFLEAVAMPNGEIIHNGKTLFWIDRDDEDITHWLYKEEC